MLGARLVNEEKGWIPLPAIHVAQRADLNPVGRRDVVCVGFNDWDNDVWTNQHHLMARLAASGSRVLFIESLGLRRPQLGSGRDLKRIIRRLRRGVWPPRGRPRPPRRPPRCASAPRPP